MGDGKVTKKGKKPKPPRLPGPPPKGDKAATKKYNALVDFVDCKGNTVTLEAGRLDWLGLDVAPDASFEADKNKPGTINIKIHIGTDTVTLPASVKNGKLELDTSELPSLDLLGAQEFVDDLNNWFEANGKKIDGAAIKDGSLTVTKAAVAAAPGKAEERGVKGGLLPHVPTWEKVGAGVLLGAAVLFGVGFMDAGDETETRTETVCPEAGGPGESVHAGIDCPEPTPDPEPVPPQMPPRSEGLAEQVGDVIIGIEGGRQAPGTVTPTKVGRLNLVLPLFAIGENHRVELRDAQGNVVDAFSFTVPAASGPMPSITTEQGGSAECTTDHENPVPPGASGEMCLYIQPEVVTTPPPDDSAPPADDGNGNAITETVTETTDGAPWSLLAIPGAAIGALGGLVLEEERRRREGGFDPTTGTYPDWETTYPDWQEPGAAEDVPPPEPPPTLDVM